MVATSKTKCKYKNDGKPVEAAVPIAASVSRIYVIYGEHRSRLNLPARFYLQETFASYRILQFSSIWATLLRCFLLLHLVTFKYHVHQACYVTLTACLSPEISRH